MKREDIKEMLDCIMTLGLEGDEAIDYIDRMIKECDGWISVDIDPFESDKLSKEFIGVDLFIPEIGRITDCVFLLGIGGYWKEKIGFIDSASHWMLKPRPPVK